MTERLLATSDCEACRPGWVSQPANTLSSLAYVATGGLLARDARRLPRAERTATRVLAGAIAAAGLGSVLYHGPGGRLSRWAHDATLVAASGLLAQRDLAVLADRPAPGPLALAAVPLAAVAATTPRTSALAQLATGAVAIGAGVARRVDEREQAPPSAPVAHSALGATWALGATLHVTGRTGGPLCRPDSPLQAHAAWHVLSAVGLWLGARPARPT
ncbi:hypothetical protein PO878_20835 [Iamia majanohamensis]|uniref:Ceramidase n=1 Tax=Iamia majanohamensis TaxID=467976 RepID=A0AAE9Y9B5_9ACTN|nr:hypothetical protein [Iamia majanohamensis]WCO66943.1 hypothetical protein PO878_20835 [Iamia majanohamensis]